MDSTHCLIDEALKDNCLAAWMGKIALAMASDCDACCFVSCMMSVSGEEGNGNSCSGVYSI